MSAGTSPCSPEAPADAGQEKQWPIPDEASPAGIDPEKHMEELDLVFEPFPGDSLGRFLFDNPSSVNRGADHAVTPSPTAD